jgi:hypothetical protein
MLDASHVALTTVVIFSGLELSEIDSTQLAESSF